MKKLFGIVCLGVLVAACAVEPSEVPETLTKDEARQLGGQWKGKKGNKSDICDVLGWYDDGICDPFCKNPDPDCDDDDNDDPRAGDVCDDGEDACGDDLYCDFNPNDCGANEQTGACKDRPETCTAQHDPVCGCDGETYSNACNARRAGTDVDHKGECEDDRDEELDSCVDHCDSSQAAPWSDSHNKCYCDTACEGYGDCCDDYEEVCD